MTEKGDLEKPLAAKNEAQRVINHVVDVKWRLWFVPMLVVFSIAVFWVTMAFNNCPQTNRSGDAQCLAQFMGRLSFEPTEENPFFGPSLATLDKLGALQWSKIVKQNESWRLITSVFLHAGVMHLVVNMLNMMFVILLEQQFGFIRVGIIYLLSGIGGSIFSLLFIRNGVSVGASGAVMGLLGATLSGLLINWTVHLNGLRALLTFVSIIGMNLILQFVPLVNNFTHIGGLLTGFLLGFMLLARPQSGWSEKLHVPSGAPMKSKYAVYQYVLWSLSTIFFIVGFATGLMMLYRGDDEINKGSWCTYISISGIVACTIARLAHAWLYV